MKQRIVTLIAVLAVLAVASPAFAQTVGVDLSGNATTSPSVKARMEAKTNMPQERENRKASSTEVRGEVKANIETRKASSTERRVEMQQSIAKRKASHTSRLLAATVQRLENIMARVESRIAKVKANGVDTTVSERFVAEAKGHLSLAKTNIALFVSVDITGDKAQENFERIRALAQETKEHIRNAHQSLMKAIRALNGRTDIQLEINANATSTQ